MRVVLLSGLSGFILGSIFSMLNLPIPAPPNLAGIMGVVGIYLGYLAFNTFF
ncbi:MULTISPECIES: XapX domain-containing protein [unclassified Candidatus Frackibacter]|uniref:XapX domain-containing protein n=1 Tax=unclassified Candidatus Frackibacter TaxID=2648818 RepID=UPI00087F3EC1|nr:MULTISPECIES: XapX domain-containing protein [unclassified Candidatus Frackibacter]SDC11136.1 XapX domain-containing protein [Candidatus Frackibacter sp. WG11]SEM36673.1 XapX domain-containing protein [Candidatus Frackibacter sp. WG12]SFL42014.1 XapX domain-containing protein [Candidatus Frackibacter sp. WG13]